MDPVVQHRLMWPVVNAVPLIIVTVAILVIGLSAIVVSRKRQQAVLKVLDALVALAQAMAGVTRPGTRPGP